jgi:hypothetical protein
VELVESNPSVHYVQGLNSVAAAVLLTEGRDSARLFLKNFALVHGSPLVCESLEETTSMLSLLDLLIGALDPPLATLLRSSPTMAHHFYALDWISTWLCHTRNDAREASEWLRQLSRMHPLAIVYVAAALVIGRRHALISLRPGAGSSLWDPVNSGSLHAIVKEIPGSLPPDQVLPVVKELMDILPPFFLLEAAPKSVQEVLRRAPVLWLLDREIPDIWPDLAKSTDCVVLSERRLKDAVHLDHLNPDVALSFLYSVRPLDDAMLRRIALAVGSEDVGPPPAQVSPTLTMSLVVAGGGLASLFVLHWLTEALYGRSWVLAMLEAVSVVTNGHPDSAVDAVAPERVWLGRMAAICAWVFEVAAMASHWVL